MTAVTIRNLPEEVHRAIKLRATHNGRSVEAEMREILDMAVRAADRVRLGAAMSALSRDASLTNADFEELEQARDRARAEPIRFE